MTTARSNADVIRQWLDNGWMEALQSGTTKTSMAKALVKTHPHLFANVESARASIRAITTPASGKATTVRSHVYVAPSGFRAPSRAEVNEDFVLDHVGRVGVLSDIHFPYHDERALNVALEGVEGCDVLYLNGDVMDCYQGSNFMRRPDLPSLKAEKDMTIQFLEYVRPRFERVIYKLGNHEARWDRLLLSKCPEFFGDPYFSFGAWLGLDDLGVELVLSKCKAKFGKLNVTHGDEFGESTFSPVNPARGLFNRAKCSTLAGHNHTTSEHNENDLNGTPMCCWSVGCLCSLTPEYRPFAYTKWNHGYAVVEIASNGDFAVDNRRILPG